MTLGSRHGFGSEPHSRNYELQQNLVCSFDTIEEGTSPIQPGRSKWEIQLRGWFSDSSKLTHSVQLLAVLTMFQDGDFRSVWAHPYELL